MINNNYDVNNSKIDAREKIKNKNCYLLKEVDKWNTYIYVYTYYHRDSSNIIIV